MSFRTKVLFIITLTVAAAVWVVAGAVTVTISRTFEQRDAERTSNLVAQFQHEFSQRGEELARRVEAIAGSETVSALARTLAFQGDTAPFVNEAQALAHEQALDFLELVAPDTSIVSSAQWPARFGYKEPWLAQVADWKPQGVFLKKEELADGTALGVMAVRGVSAGQGSLWIVGGERLNDDFLKRLPLAEGMQVRLAPGADTGPVLAALGPDYRVSSIPLRGRDGDVLATLVVANSRRDLDALRRDVRRVALLVAVGAIALGVVLSFWAASWVTRPVRLVAASVRKVAGGDWAARAEVRSGDEIDRLAADFNAMTAQLVEQKDRMIQVERVAAWRELARRLAHELKNPLVPLQITVENLQRAREAPSGQFDEVFRESTETLLAELNNFKTIIGRFSDFAKMPPPQLEQTDVNQLVKETMQLFDAQLEAPSRPPIASRLELATDLPRIAADPDQLRGALRNLVLNGMDAMPNGGTLTLATALRNGRVRVEVSDTGEGLTKEECQRLFTPYYTTKRHGTGLGLAIVQSVVADHKGTIAVESQPGKGTTFRLEFDAARTKETGA